MTLPQQDREKTWEFVSQVDRHKCELPQRQDYGTHFEVSDIIRCKGCHKHYILVGLDYGNQRDPIHPPALNWNLTSYSQEKP